MKLSVRDFTREPSTYIDRVARGESFELTRYGKVVARLLPPEEVVIADEIRRTTETQRPPLDAVGPPREAGRGKATSYADRQPGQAARDTILGAARGRHRE
jgi:antitoxin (DNA-binding transcriptional repressor) of toxin-antitoxin stability system